MPDRIAPTHSLDSLRGGVLMRNTWARWMQRSGCNKRWVEAIIGEKKHVTHDLLPGTPLGLKNGEAIADRLN